MAPDLPATLLTFIQDCIPTYQAAELLLFMAANPDSAFTPEEIVTAMRPVDITVSAVKEYTAALAAASLIRERGGTYQYSPRPDLEMRVGELRRAYNEKPVTLVRATYHIADRNIRSFADAFKLRRDER
jgi:hypothetical protein